VSLHSYYDQIAGATPHSMIDHRKKPQPPILHSVPPTKVVATNTSSTKPNYSQNKNNEIIPSSGPISSQLHIPDVMVLSLYFLSCSLDNLFC